MSPVNSIYLAKGVSSPEPYVYPDKENHHMVTHVSESFVAFRRDSNVGEDVMGLSMTCVCQGKNHSMVKIWLALSPVKKYFPQLLSLFIVSLAPGITLWAQFRSYHSNSFVFL